MATVTFDSFAEKVEYENKLRFVDYFRMMMNSPGILGNLRRAKKYLFIFSTNLTCTSAPKQGPQDVKN